MRALGTRRWPGRVWQPIIDNAGLFVHPFAVAMPDMPSPITLPDRLAQDPRSPYFVRELFEHDIGIRFNGKERFDVAEYCISEGWVKVPAGKTLDRRGQPLLIKLKGTVEAFVKAA